MEMISRFVAVTVIAMCAACALAATYSDDATITSISGNNVFNGAGKTIVFETTKDTSASGWLSVEGNGDNPVTFRGKDDSDEYGFSYTGETYVGGGGGSGSLKIESGTFVGGGDVWIAQNGNNTGTVEVVGGSFSSTKNIIIGRNANSIGYFLVGGGTCSFNSLYVSDNNTARGYMIVTNGNVNLTYDFAIAQKSSSTGTVTVAGGTVTAKTLFVGAGGFGTLNINGGKFITNGGDTYFGNTANTSIGVMNINAGGVFQSGSGENTQKWIQFASKSGSQATINLNEGGILRGSKINHNYDGTGAVYFNGGTFQAIYSDEVFYSKNSDLTVELKEKGGTIDTQGYTCSINKNVTVSGCGGLTKKGTGTLTLNAEPTFTGKITVLPGAGKVIVKGDSQCAIEPGANTTRSEYANGQTEYSYTADDYETTTIGDGTAYVLKTWLARVYADGYAEGTIPAGFSTAQSGDAMSGADAYALGFASIPAASADTMESVSLDGSKMTFGFKDASMSDVASRGATVKYYLKSGTSPDSLVDGAKTSSLPTLDISTVSGVKYYKLAADVTW